MAYVYCRLTQCTECKRLTYEPMRSGPSRSVLVPGAERSIRSIVNYRDYTAAWYPPIGSCNECADNLKKFTVINTCDLCKKIGIPRRVRYRSDVFGWNRNNSKDFEFDQKNVLCTGCWNKVRSLLDKEEKSRAITQLLNKLKREASECQKSRLPANSESFLPAQSTL